MHLSQCYTFRMVNHVLQSPLWGEFKSKYGTEVVHAGGIIYTKHKIPFSSYYYAYSGRVHPQSINFDELKESLKQNNCIALHFDVPNVLIGSEEETECRRIFEKHCSLSPRDEFAKGNLLLGISGDLNGLLDNMHKKHRYNIKYAEAHGIKVRTAETEEDFDIFYRIYSSTGDRQHFFGRSRLYMKYAWETFKNAGAGDILIAEFNGTPLSAWMLFTYDNVLYYPYGGSLEDMKNIHHSTYLGWAAIKYGKEKGCTTFDMWGAATDMTNESDPYHNFSLFKSKFGATHVVYIDSYDLILNESVYTVFNTANSLRWKVLNFLR